MGMKSAEVSPKKLEEIVCAASCSGHRLNAGFSAPVSSWVCHSADFKRNKGVEHVYISFLKTHKLKGFLRDERA